MEAEQFLDILHQAALLKTNTRHNWIRKDRKESVADHSWRIALMAMLLSGEEEFRDADMDRVIRMCLIHDLGESFTGDIPSFEKTKDDEKKEDRLFDDWAASFPEPQRQQWQQLLTEMRALETREARIYKALDKLEAVISHDEADIASWLPEEYSLQLTYGKENVSFSPYLRELKAAIDRETETKIAEKENGRCSRRHTT